MRSKDRVGVKIKKMRELKDLVKKTPKRYSKSSQPATSNQQQVLLHSFHIPVQLFFHFSITECRRNDFL